MLPLKDKIVVIIGGTGSLGKTLVHRILNGEQGTPKKIIVFSRDEAKQHEMRIAYQCKKATTDEIIYSNFLNVLEFRIGDVRNYDDVCSVVKTADIVFYAAALKQVPACEYFPKQALLTNCLGAQNVVQAIDENNYPVRTVIGISTDKACKPVNVMGMTKALQERIMIAANILNPKTRFVCVRYGNVLASRGSVIPLFHEQIRASGPLTITHPEMTRFLLSLDEAADTVFAALCHGFKGETFIPIVPSATVLNIAKALIGDKDIKIEVTGVRPGEKMHELLISEEEIHRTTKRSGYYVIKPMLPELLEGNLVLSKELAGKYCSADNVLSLEQTRLLLGKYNLLSTNQPDGYELLC